MEAAFDGRHSPARAPGEPRGRASPSKPRRSPAIDRRELLLAATTLAAIVGLPRAAPAQTTDLTVLQFASLSNAIAGFPPADPDVVAAFLDAFADQMADLVELYDIIQVAPEDEWQDWIDTAGLSPLAEALTTAWYTGTVGLGPQEQVLTYLDAFAWYAVEYTKPPTRCDLAFGAWSKPPHEPR